LLVPGAEARRSTRRLIQPVERTLFEDAKTAAKEQLGEE
jgi:hypothetical protein